MKPLYKKGLFIALALVVLGLGVGTGYFMAERKYTSFLGSFHLIRADNATHSYIRPLLGIQTPNALSVGQFTDLSEKIQEVFNSNAIFLKRYSIYFRDLSTGLWFGINENDQYNPASMLKVALAMGAYKEAEADPSFLKIKETYTPALAAIITQVSDSVPSELTVGDSYTVVDLITKMLVDSDNGAKDILGNSVDPQYAQDIYTDFNLKPPVDTEEYTISPRQYGLFFSRLYSATYLNEESSNSLLGILSEASFKNALAAGVPDGIKVAHKFGERVTTNDNSIDAVELHDCGIIYNTKHPYLLCVMTQGKTESDLANIIASVSSVAYNEAEQDYGK